MPEIRWVEPENSTIKSTLLDAPFGRIGVHLMGDALWKLEFLPHGHKSREKLLEFHHPIVTKLSAYFSDPKTTFSFSLVFKSTDFKKRVWEKLNTIEVGSTCTYGDLAKSLHTSPRAIGGACRENDFPIIIPCHRVVSATGVGGFCGSTTGEQLGIKHWLLNHERRHASS